MGTTWDELVAFATSTFPRTEESTSWGSPSLKVAGRMIVRVRVRDEQEARGALVLRCSPADKAALVAGDDPAFFTTSHYDGHDYVLVDTDLVDPEELRELVTEAWLLTAPVRVRQAWQSAQ